MAVGILSTGIVIILQALAFSARSAGLFCDIARAVFLAQDKIQELEVKEKKRAIAPIEQEAGRGKFTLRYEITSETGSALYKLKLRVRWMRQNRDEALDAFTYLRNSGQ
jgi:hypothetical protein